MNRPQDEGVSRRWFLNRMAWVSSSVATGTVLSRMPASASPLGPRVPEEAYATVVRQEAIDDLTELTLSESMTLVRKGTVTPADLVNAHVDRIERFGDRYLAYAARPTRESLLGSADQAPADGVDVPLRGICLAPKDNFYTSDLLTEGGSLVYEGFQPEYDATARNTWLVGRASIRQVVRDTARRGKSPSATSPSGDEGRALEVGG